MLGQRVGLGVQVAIPPATQATVHVAKRVSNTNTFVLAEPTQEAIYTSPLHVRLGSVGSLQHRVF